MNQFLLGTISMACAVIGLFFVHFWRKTHDRLFAIFGAAFWILGLNWLALAIYNTDEVRTLLYLVRLIAFLLIIAGILDKNRTTSRRNRDGSGAASGSNLKSQI